MRWRRSQWQDSTRAFTSVRIAIITIHHVPNYGAVLQAFALADYLRAAGHDVETVDYRPRCACDYYRVPWRIPPRMNMWLRRRRCLRFVERHVRLSHRLYRSVDDFAPDAAGYDVLITGSDQVWFTGSYQKFDRMFFLDCASGKARKLSYAASVGGSESFGLNTQQVRRALSSLDHLSVRDEHSRQLVEALCDKPVETVVDPIFLCDFRRLPHWWNQRPSQGPYLLVFGNFGEAESRKIREMADQEGLRLVALQYRLTGADQRIPAPDPVTWLQYCRHAERIVTSYFHGTAFAVKFEKPFVAVPTPGRRQKVHGLLQPLGLSNRCQMEVPDAEKVSTLEPIIWQDVRSRLEKRIARSQRFLDKALCDVPSGGSPRAR